MFARNTHAKMAAFARWFEEVPTINVCAGRDSTGRIAKKRVITNDIFLTSKNLIFFLLELFISKEVTEFVGCYKTVINELFEVRKPLYSSKNVLESCFRECYLDNYMYFGVEVI